MTNMLRYASLIAFCFFVIVCGIGSSACGDSAKNASNAVAAKSPTPDPCAAKTDKEIVTAIYAEIDKDPDLKKQHGQINVISVKHEVALWGWVENAAQHGKVIDIATKASCVKNVDSSNFYDNENNPTRLPPTGCVPPLVQCSDICQPASLPCDSIGDPIPAGNVNTKSGNMNTKTGNANVKK